MLLGALAQSIPDIDFVSAFWNDPATNLLAHRGFTHSLLFDLLITTLFAWIAKYFDKTHRVSLIRWLLFFGLQGSIHLFIDLFNSYGIGLLEPFSHQRFSLNTLFVADPFFSIWPAISFVALLLLKRGVRQRIFWWRFGIALSSIYLFYCCLNKLIIEKDIRLILGHQKIAHQKYLTTPTPLNNWLWYVVVKNDSGYLVGYRSVFDKRNSIDFNFFPRKENLLQPFIHTDEVKKLVRFSQDYFTIEKWNDTLVFNDLRFGQVIGWYDPNERFVFHYFLQHPAKDNKLVVQRGRFAKWNKNSIDSLLSRMAGN